MKNPAYAFALGLSFSLCLALPAAADFAPLKVGNVWKYQGHVSFVGWTSPREVEAMEKLEVRVTRFEMDSGRGTWTVRLVDTLYDRGMWLNSGGRTALKDTVITATMTFREEDGGHLTRTSVSPASFPAPFFQTTLNNALQSPAYFRNHGIVPGSKELEGESGGYAARENQFNVSGGFVRERSWVVDDVGLYWLEGIYSGHCEGVERVLVLKSFNGRSVDLGLEVPKQPLAKESKIACSTLKRPSGGLAAALRMPSGAALDLLGRALPDLSAPILP